MDDSRKDERSGIGLSLTQEIIKLMNSSVSVKGKPGNETSFRISLPYLPPHSQLTSFSNEQFSGDVSAMDMPDVLENASKKLMQKAQLQAYFHQYLI